MATSAQIAQQMRQYGNISPGGSTNNKVNEWQKMLNQLMAAQKLDAGTMGGFALGKLLRGAFDTWKENYDKRGELKAKKGKSETSGETSTWQQALNDAKKYDFNGSYADMRRTAQPVGGYFDEASLADIRKIIQPDTTNDLFSGMTLEDMRKILGR